MARGLREFVSHGPQRVSSSQTSALFQFSPWLSVLPLSFSSAHFVLSLFYPGRVLVLLWTMGVIMGNQDPRIKRGSGFRDKESMLQIYCQGHCEHWAGCAS